jgi:hypothetical protein
VAAVATDRLLVEVTDVEAALQLVEELRGVHAEITPGDDPRCLVVIELDPADAGWMARVTDGLERWAKRVAVRSVLVRLDKRGYLLEGEWE